MSFFFFFNDTATTEIYTLSLHDALPIWVVRASATLEISELVPTLIAGTSVSTSTFSPALSRLITCGRRFIARSRAARCRDRKSTRLNSSHSQISYAVFCLKKKNTTQNSKFHRTDDRYAFYLETVTPRA